jgi:cation:H+ antiporter
LFVRGLVGLAAWLRVPARLVGATVAAFATSSPELTVAVNAAADGRPEIALGDALGSNLVNIGLVVGIVVLLGGTSAANVSRRDAFVAAGTAGLIGLLMLRDDELSRRDGIVLLLVFATWLSLVVEEALQSRAADRRAHAADGDNGLETIGERRHARAIGTTFVGVLLLIAAGRLLVVGAKGVGAELGLSTFVIGVVIVSVGTSLPELATALAASIRGHAELGLGTILGSNIFNVGFIVGVAAVLAPIPVEPGDVAISLVFGIAMFPILLWRTGGTLRRWRGALLIASYVTALAVLLLAE